MKKKRIFCIILVIMLIAQSCIGSAETLKTKTKHLYQADGNFSLTDSDIAEATNDAVLKDTLGVLVVDADVKEESTIQDVQALYVAPDTEVSFSYQNICKMLDTTSSWYLADAEASTIAGIDFGGSIKRGGIVIQRSFTGSKWSNVYQSTNVFGNDVSNLDAIFQPASVEINRGCFYRVIIAYKVEHKTGNNASLSSVEQKYLVEEYQLYIKAYNRDADPAAAKLTNAPTAEPTHTPAPSTDKSGTASSKQPVSTTSPTKENNNAENASDTSGKQTPSGQSTTATQEKAKAKTVNVNKLHFYQSKDHFSTAGSDIVERMTMSKSSLGTLVVDSTVLSESTFQNTQSLIVKTSTAVSFSYKNILQSVVTTSGSNWHLVDANTSKIDSLDFSDNINKGGILVQKSFDGSEWTTTYHRTNAFATYKTNLNNFYSPLRSDINNGCFYRIVIAYKTERKTKDSSFLFIDTSTYEQRWHVEEYQIFIISDEEYTNISTISFNGTSASANTDAGTTGFGNQSAANLDAAAESFTWGDSATGYGAEAANVQSYAEQGVEVEHVGGNNVKNGTDYTITSSDGLVTQIQCKYYATPSQTISACFEDGIFRYYSDTGVPMTIEVPQDQYDKCVQLMRNRITNNQVPGVTDPNKAEEIVKAGSVTYKQAQNLAKAGTIESLTYDAKTGCVSALGALGISAVVQFAVSLWNHESVEDALKNSLYAGLRVGGNAFVTSILSSQLTRTGLNSLLVPASEAVIKAIGPKAAAVIVNAGRVGLTPIYGAAAMKSAAKMLRGGVIVNTISFLVFTIPDIVNVFRGKISGKQLLKNAAVTVIGISGAGVGAAAGTAIGTAIAPGLGTAIGGVVGSLVGGIASSIGADAIADLIAEDDADEMLDIVSTEFQNLTEEYLLNNDEATAVSNALQEKLDANKLTDMYASTDRNAFARNIILPLVTSQVSKRKKIELPEDETIYNALVDTLEEIYDMDLASDE